MATKLFNRAFSPPKTWSFFGVFTASGNPWKPGKVMAFSVWSRKMWKFWECCGIFRIGREKGPN